MLYILYDSLLGPMIMHVSGLVVVDKKTTMYVYARMCFFCVCSSSVGSVFVCRCVDLLCVYK